MSVAARTETLKLTAAAYALPTTHYPLPAANCSVPTLPTLLPNPSIPLPATYSHPAYTTHTAGRGPHGTPYFHAHF